MFHARSLSLQEDEPRPEGQSPSVHHLYGRLLRVTGQYPSFLLATPSTTGVTDIISLSARLQTKLFLSSETPIAEIFSSEEDLSERSEIDDSARAMIDDLGVVPDAEGVHSSMFTGEEEVFAFKRCISRLTEMGGERWAAFEGAAPGS